MQNSIWQKYIPDSTFSNAKTENKQEEDRREGGFMACISDVHVMWIMPQIIPCPAPQSQQTLSSPPPRAVHYDHRVPEHNGRSWIFWGWRVAASQSEHEIKPLHCMQQTTLTLSIHSLIYTLLSHNIAFIKPKISLVLLRHDHKTIFVMWNWLALLEISFWFHKTVKYLINAHTHYLLDTCYVLCKCNWTYLCSPKQKLRFNVWTC